MPCKHSCASMALQLFAGGLVTGVAISTLLLKKLKDETSSSSSEPKRAPGIKAWRMSKWIKHDGVLRTQGLCGDFSKPSSTEQQTKEALEKLDNILKECGLTRKNLLSVTIFLKDIEMDFDEMNKVYDAWVDPKGLPTRLCVQAWMGPNVQVEIRAEAYY